MKLRTTTVRHTEKGSVAHIPTFPRLLKKDLRLCATGPLSKPPASQCCKVLLLAHTVVASGIGRIYKVGAGWVPVDWLPLSAQSGSALKGTSSGPSDAQARWSQAFDGERWQLDC